MENMIHKMMVWKRWLLLNMAIFGIYITIYRILGGTLPGTNRKFAPVNRPQNAQGFPSIHFQVLALFLGLYRSPKDTRLTFGFGWTRRNFGGLHHASHYRAKRTYPANVFPFYRIGTWLLAQIITRLKFRASCLNLSFKKVKQLNKHASVLIIFWGKLWIHQTICSSCCLLHFGNQWPNLCSCVTIRFGWNAWSS